MEPRSSLFRNASIVPTAQNIFQVSTSYVISYYKQNSISKTMYHLFSEYAEAVPDGETCRSLREVAKSSKVYLIGGSIPERESDKLYNTLTVWSPDGELLQTHRKMHLFDIDIPGKITFRGEIFFSPNNQPFC